MREKQYNLIAYIFLLPALVLFFIFNFCPIIYSAYLSTIKWDGFSRDKKFVGIQNYFQIITNNEFYHSLFVTIIYTLLVTFISLIIGMILASLLNNSIKGKLFFRTAYFIPVITATAAAGVVWKYMFDPTQGIINKFFNFVNLPSIPWLNNPFWVIISISIVGIWKKIGFNLIIYLSALQSISPVYYEAADIDGASSIKKFIKITLPLLKPTTFLLIIMSFIDSFQIFDQVYVMTNGGPMGASDVLGLFMYREGFKVGHLGYASAVGWIIFAFIFTLTIAQSKLSNKGE
ncbi:sugar ABC transporter permease [Clostridium sediminicola]|uniref:carbohydrate ABC transporter permease n=1 Tax=Clostridium sediminicola TaxID=3114879 RepID=UPI0031F2571D